MTDGPPLVPQPRHRRRAAGAAHGLGRARRPGARAAAPVAGCRGSCARPCTATLALLAVALLGGPRASRRSLDTYVDIRWWQAFVPVGGDVPPAVAGAGRLVARPAAGRDRVTSLLRTRLRHRAWRLVHLLSYVALGAVAWRTAIGIGTDLQPRTRPGPSAHPGLHRRRRGWRRLAAWSAARRARAVDPSRSRR